MRTRSQRDLQEALRCVREVEGENAAVRKVYGGLCHRFPVMVYTIGLTQTLAFHEAKASSTGTVDQSSQGDKAKEKPQRSAGGDEARGDVRISGADRKKAHALLLRHVAQVLGHQAQGQQKLSEYVAAFDAETYMYATRRVLQVWIYFKRFAVSILKVESSSDSDE